MECQHKKKCLNHPEKCNACGQISDMYNHYPLLKIRDLVEVVKCKDCEHLTVHNSPTLYAYCEKTQLRFEPFKTDTRTHFCSYGKRKEGAEE
jgi:hypothetical protein